MYKLSDYNYKLPEDRIAQSPVQPAHDSKLLCCKFENNKLTVSDHRSYDLPNLLPSNTLLIANNSQVFAARIPLHNTKIILSSGEETLLESGEIFIVRVLFTKDNQIDQHRCIIWWSDKKHFKPGTKIIINDDSYGYSQEFVDDGIVREIHGITLEDLCTQYGDMPLPPYITNTSKENQQLYKTSFGNQQGSVATPTAWLHFTPALRNKLQQHHIKRQEITLHVGIGTFAPVVSEDIRNHSLHAETITISYDIFEIIYNQKQNNNATITIGTTSTRSIESLPYLYNLLDTKFKQRLSDSCRTWRDEISQSCQNSDFLLIISMNSDTITFSSSLFIYPWYERMIIDGIITNFHLPQTSLVMLVAGLIGYHNRKQVYDHALSHSYRFASFWDAMCINFTTL